MKKNTKNILAIIPARGGSKRVPKKNIKELAGKPLITYTIEAALKSKHINKVIVSTDSKEIAKLSKKYKAEIINRPKKLSGDKSKSIDIIPQVLRELKKFEYDPEIVVFLQPTSPLRTAKDIDKALEVFFKNKCDGVVSVYKDSSVLFSFKLDKYLKNVINKKNLSKRSQDLSNIYIPNGAIYVYQPKTLLKYRSFYPPKMLPYIMTKEKSTDIDEEIDFKLAELLLKFQ